MKKSNLRNFQAYRMYQAPQGGAENRLRTSYLKDPLDASTPRGVGGAGARPHCQGQNMSALCQGQYMSAQCQGQNMSGQYMSGQNMTAPLEHSRHQHRLRGVALLQGAGSCPVVDTLHSTCQEPSDSRRVAKPASVTAAYRFKVIR